MRQKNFEDLVPEDKLYILNPRTQAIMELTVLKVALHPRSLNKQVYLVEFYTPLSKEGVTEDVMKVAKDLGTPNATTKVLVPKGSHMVTLTLKLPTVLCTSKEYLQKWMDQSKEEIKKLEWMQNKKKKV